MDSFPGARKLEWSFLKDVLMLAFTFIAGCAHSACGHFASEGPALKSGYRKKTLLYQTRKTESNSHSHKPPMAQAETNSIPLSLGVRERIGGRSLLSETWRLHRDFPMMMILSEQPKLIGRSQPRTSCPRESEGSQLTCGHTLQPAAPAFIQQASRPGLHCAQHILQFLIKP